MAFDLSTLAQPGDAAASGNPMPAPNPGTPPPATMTPPVVPPSMTPPPDTGVNPAVPPAPPAGGTPVGTPNPPRHAALLGMVQGLALGLSSFGSAISTGGREGGAKEVAEVQDMQARTKIAQQQSAVAAKNAELQQKLTAAETNRVNGQNLLMFGTMPDEIAKSHLEVSGQKLAQGISEADFQATHGGYKPEEFSTMLSSADPVNTQDKAGSFFVNNARQSLLAAKTAGLADNDPYVEKLNSVLGSPNAIAKDIYVATQQLDSQRQKQSSAIDEKVKRESAESGSPVAKLSTPEALAAPGAQAAIQAKIDDPKTSPSDIPRLRQLLPQAALAQKNAENIKARELRTQQVINQGDPNEAGRLLANRSLTLEELKSRQVTPQFIDSAVAAAQKFDPTFKAPEAAAQSRIAANSANAQFFGNTDSLLVKGGTLDQLAAAYKALGNTKIPIINKIENLRKAAIGSGPLAAAYAAQLGVADDYSKVISGGAGSDSSRQQALDIMATNLSPEGQDASIGQIRQTIESQRNGRVGTNPYMKDMYPDPATRQEVPGQAGTQAAAPNFTVKAPDGSIHTFKDQQGVDAFKKLAGIN